MSCSRRRPGAPGRRPGLSSRAVGQVSLGPPRLALASQTLRFHCVAGRRPGDEGVPETTEMLMQGLEKKTLSPTVSWLQRPGGCPRTAAFFVEGLSSGQVVIASSSLSWHFLSAYPPSFLTTQHPKIRDCTSCSVSRRIAGEQTARESGVAGAIASHRREAECACEGVRTLLFQTRPKPRCPIPCPLYPL